MSDEEWHVGSTYKLASGYACYIIGNGRIVRVFFNKRLKEWTYTGSQRDDIPRSEERYFIERAKQAIAALRLTDG